MGPIILALILTWAFKHAWDHSRDDFKKSKAAHRQRQPAKQKRAAELVHHDIGYWTHQTTHGFPEFRHGFGKGWHDARGRAVKAREARERAKAEHLETAADLEPQVTDHKRRQDEALERIREARQPGEGAGEGSPDVQPDDAPVAEADLKPASQPSQEPEVPQVTTIEGDQSMTEGSGLGTNMTSPNNKLVRHYSDVGHNAGGIMPAAADTTYDGVLSSMAAAKNVAEGNAAEAQTASRNADNLADEMQALEVDPATLSAMADHQAAHDDVTKAYQRLLDSAESVVATLKRGHQGLAEAHQNAPVEAAEKQFYAA